MKKIFALLSLFLVALLLVGCESPFTKTTNNGTQPQTTTNNNTQSKVLTSELDPEAQKEQNETLKKALSQAVEQSLLNSNATKLSVELSLYVEAELSMKSLLQEAYKERATELEADTEITETANVKFDFTFKFEIDTEALTIALSTNFNVTELDLNMSDVDEDDYEMIKSLFFDDGGYAKSFDLFIFYTYETNTVQIGLSQAVKEGIIAVVNMIFKGDAKASVDKILPKDGDNFFVLDFNEYLKAQENEEEDPEIAKLNEAKANFKQTLNSGAGFVRGQSVASAYRTLKSMAISDGMMDEEMTINFDAVINMIAMAIASDNASDESEEYSAIVETVKAFIEDNIRIYVDGDDYVAELPEQDYLKATFGDEEETPIVDYFDIDTDSLSELKALLKINFNFTQTQFDGLSVELKANIKGSDKRSFDYEYLDNEGAKQTESLNYDMEADATVTITASFKISSTLSLKAEDIFPANPEDFTNMLDNPDTVEEIDDFMIDNFYKEEAEPIMVVGGEE